MRILNSALPGSGCAASLMFAFGVGAASAQTLTIPEAIERMNVNPYVTSRITEIAPIPFEQAIEVADLIVYGSLEKVGTFMSADQRDLYTDYEVTPQQIIAGAPQGPRLILQQWGGETELNGIHVRIFDENIPPLPTGAPLLLLMSFNPESRKYTITGNFAGAFRIGASGELHHLVRGTVSYYEHLKGAAVSDVVSEIRRKR